MVNFLRVDSFAALTILEVKLSTLIFHSRLLIEFVKLQTGCRLKLWKKKSESGSIKGVKRTLHEVFLGILFFFFISQMVNDSMSLFYESEPGVVSSESSNLRRLDAEGSSSSTPEPIRPAAVLKRLIGEEPSVMRVDLSPRASSIFSW